ncbi:MAG: GspE/PulE family protein [Dialister invisus]
MEILRAANAEIAMRRILQAAVSEKASDVHLEPCREFVLVRFRIDGTLTERYRLPPDMAAGLSVRAKVLGGMDVGENRIPQDGSFSEIREGKNTDFRLSVMPSVYGETIVIRILSGQMDFIEKNELGMLPLQKKIFRTKIGKKSGMILTTGPTGSGKTSTLYAALKLVCRPEISVISVEDPVEYRIPGITQVEVNEKAGLTFEKGLRSLVRQDPDVVMIGEIRDRETAEIAIHAALTGHLVLSTLHTNDAVSAPARLTDMGIPPYLLSASLSLIISQRLVRNSVPPAGRKWSLQEKWREKLFPEAFIGRRAYMAKGCDHCKGKGADGRTGVFEMLEIGKEERRLLHENAAAEEFSECMRKQGQYSLKESLLRLMESGAVPPEEAALLWE